MKKKVVSILLAVVLVVGLGTLGFGSKATENIMYEGDRESGSIRNFTIVAPTIGNPEPWSGQHQGDKIELTRDGNNVEVVAYGQTFDPIVFSLKNGEKPLYANTGGIEYDEVYEFVEWYTNGSLNKKPEGGIIVAFTETNCFIMMELKDNHVDNATGEFNGNIIDGIFLEATLTATETPEPTDPQTVSTEIMGRATSNTGQYELLISGFFEDELMEGENILTLADIKTQTMVIIAKNNNNDVNRVMRETTVEEMTITVKGGEITNVYIKGRVQTDGGTLDRYNVNIAG